MTSRSYTPPTCTLKVTAKGFAVLAWMGLPRRQRFSLSFDDPRVPETEHITIRGDRSQLDTLHQVITTYVQEFINSSTELPPDEQNIPLEENDSNTQLEDSQSKKQENTAPITNYQISLEKQEIYLRSRDLLTHELFLGRLANKESGSFISLSMLQLYDLAIALDECQTDLQTLPQFQLDSEANRIPEWLGSGILIMITAGLTITAIKLYDRYAISKKQPGEIATVDPTINNQSIPPQISPSATPLPTVTPSPLLPSPPTNLPTPTTSPVPIVKPSPIQTPSPLFPQPNSTPSTPPNLPAPPNNVRPAPPNQGVPATVVIPAAPSLTPPLIPPPAIPNYGGVPAQPRSPVQPAPNLQVQPPPPPSQYIPPTISRARVKPFVDVTRIPVNVPGTIELPPLQDVEPTFAQQQEPENLPNGKDPSTLDSRKAALDPTRVRNARQPQSKLLDKIPQVVEVREYFQASWKPPQDLDKNLQYSLLLNGDGSVEKIIPIGQASVEFYTNTNMPLEEEVFVSNIEGGKTAKIRVVLRPDGQVQTFLESLN